MNLLTAYLVGKALEKLDNSSYGSSYSETLGAPKKESVKAVLNEQKDNVALAYHIRNLYKAQGSYCATANRKTLHIVEKYCRAQGMTLSQKAEVDKYLKQHQGQDAVVIAYGVQFYKIPNHFTKQQIQYMCAGLGEYANDAVVIAKENGTEAHIMSFNTNKYNEARPFTDMFSPHLFNVEQSTAGVDFCTTYNPHGHMYLEVHIESKGEMGINVPQFQDYIARYAFMGFSRTVPEKQAGKSLLELEFVASLHCKLKQKEVDIDEYINSFGGKQDSELNEPSDKASSVPSTDTKPYTGDGNIGEDDGNR